MDKEKIILYVALGLIAFLGISNVFKSCDLQKEQKKLYEYQLAQSDSLQKMIRAKVQVRLDSTKILTERIHETIKYVEKKKDEINQISDIDSLVAVYFRTWPDSTEIR